MVASFCLFYKVLNTVRFTTQSCMQWRLLYGGVWLGGSRSVGSVHGSKDGFRVQSGGRTVLTAKKCDCL